MNNTPLILLMAAATAVASAQTTATPAAAAKTSAKPVPAATSGKAAAVPGAGAKKVLSASVPPPPGVPVVKTLKHTAFSLTYQEIKVGTGPEAEPGKMYSVLYSGYRAADWAKFDSSDDHRQPLRDKDGKPVMGDDGKPKMGDPQPLVFPQGQRRLIPGFDQGFGGMKVGGKRRLFIPWQLAYGTQAMPDHGADHPGIPAKSDLIFDIELVSVADMPAPQAHPGMGGMGAMPPGHPVPMGNHPGMPGAPAAAGTPASTATPPVPATALAPGKPATAAPAATAPAASAPATTATPTAPAAPAQPQSK